MLSVLLQRLQELHLQENSIELLEDQALAGLSSLALLDLSRNHLGTISREALQPLASLQVLRLTGTSWGKGSPARVPSLATVVAGGSTPRCEVGSDGSGSESQTIRERPGGSSRHHHLHPWEAERNGGAGRGTAQGPCLRKTEKVEMSRKS